MIRPPSTRWVAQQLTGLVAALGAMASTAGLVLPDLYREQALAPAMRGGDLVTLAACAVLATALIAERRGSRRARLVVPGLLAYLLYTFTGAAFAYRFNQLFLLYVALFSLALAALYATVAALDRRQRWFDGAAPRKGAALFLAAIASLLALSELAQIVAALRTGTEPPLIAMSEGAGNFVYALDLGVVAPLSLAAAAGLWRARPWADVLASLLLVGAGAMGLALSSMTWFAAGAGAPPETALTVGYALVGAGGVALSVALLRHLGAGDHDGDRFDAMSMPERRASA
jgi:thiamine transporter ThiT